MKAHDRVEWMFLEKMMGKMGFSDEWIRIIMRCVGSVNFSIRLNGDTSEKFTPSRGLQQGDSLSPYLFLFCVEGFSALLKHAQQEQNFKGVKFRSTGPHVTHLLFADDNVVFLEGSQGNLQVLKEILQTYEDASGQKVNLQKSSNFFLEKDARKGTRIF